MYAAFARGLRWVMHRWRDADDISMATPVLLTQSLVSTLSKAPSIHSFPFPLPLPSFYCTLSEPCLLTPLYHLSRPSHPSHPSSPRCKSTQVRPGLELTNLISEQ